MFEKKTKDLNKLKLVFEQERIIVHQAFIMEKSFRKNIQYFKSSCYRNVIGVL